MLKWYKNLYIGDNAEKNADKLIHKINRGVGVLDVYLVTLASNPLNSLEIFSANMLLQKPVRRNCPIIVGLASGYDEGIKIVEKITREVYEETGAVHIREWLIGQIKMQEKD